MKQTEIETFCPSSRQDWRQWLIENHASRQSVWLLQFKQRSAKPSLSWSDSVDEALCFGWIDSTRRTIDEESFIQFFTRRKPTSNWSKINKAKVERLINEGLMTEAGLKSIEVAKTNGSWTNLDEVEELIVPMDLAQALIAEPSAEDYFNGLSKSIRKMMLQWIVLAKRPETREKRIAELAKQAAQKMKPKQFR
jgi:uncharacterized protein YdeI (YjbR/CyaY-like superfamily)